jgi:hypothetical protein
VKASRSRSGESGAAQSAVGRQAARCRVVDVGRAFHVAELADVGVEAVGPGPAEEDVTGGLHDSLTDDDPLAVVPVR